MGWLRGHKCIQEATEGTLSAANFSRACSLGIMYWSWVYQALLLTAVTTVVQGYTTPDMRTSSMLLKSEVSMSERCLG